MSISQQIIDQTITWIHKVVVGCNFCPFAAKTLYRNNLKNREFDKEASQDFCPEQSTIAERQGASEDENSERMPTSSKTDSSGYFGIQQHHVHYQVEASTNITLCLDAFLKEIARLDKEPHIETSFLIFSNAFQQFDDYLDMASIAEHLLKEKGYEGVYQLASFHPMYRFASSVENDAADYTNRSIYPMLQFLRETSIDRALKHYENPENIPERNVDFARKKGLTFMKLLRDSCYTEVT